MHLPLIAHDACICTCSGSVLSKVQFHGSHVYIKLSVERTTSEETLYTRIISYIHTEYGVGDMYDAIENSVRLEVSSIVNSGIPLVVE